MEHDSLSLLFRLGCEYLRSAKVIRLGVVPLLEKVATSRQFDRGGDPRPGGPPPDRRAPRGLDGLLVVEPKLRSTRLHWLVTGPVQASPNSVKAEAEKLLFLRGLGANTLDLSALPERRRHLAQIGHCLSAQALVRWKPHRRHPILQMLLAQSAVDVLDSVVQVFGQTLSGSESHARIKLQDELAERAKLSEDRLALLDKMLPVLADAGIPDEAVGTLLRGKIGGMSRLRAAHAEATAQRATDTPIVRMKKPSGTAQNSVCWRSTSRACVNAEASLLPGGNVPVWCATPSRASTAVQPPADEPASLTPPGTQGPWLLRGRT